MVVARQTHNANLTVDRTEGQEDRLAGGSMADLAQYNPEAYPDHRQANYDKS